MNYQLGNSVGKATPGMGEIWFCPVEDFTTIATLPANPATLEEEVTISDDHTFDGTKGFQKLYSSRKKKNLKVSGFGDEDATGGMSVLEIFHPGDNPKLDALIKRNKDLIILVGDVDCGVNTYKQIGTKCNPAKILPDWEYNGGTLGGSDAAGTTMRIEGFASSKLYYTGAVTESTEV